MWVSVRVKVLVDFSVSGFLQMIWPGLSKVYIRRISFIRRSFCDHWLPLTLEASRQVIRMSLLMCAWCSSMSNALMLFLPYVMWNTNFAITLPHDDSHWCTLVMVLQLVQWILFGISTCHGLRDVLYVLLLSEIFESTSLVWTTQFPNIPSACISGLRVSFLSKTGRPLLLLTLGCCLRRLTGVQTLSHTCITVETMVPCVTARTAGMPNGFAPSMRMLTDCAASCLFGTLVIVMATSQRSKTSGSVRCRVLPQDRHKTWVHVPDHFISPLMTSSDPAQVSFPCCQRRWEPSAHNWQYGTPTAQVNHACHTHQAFFRSFAGAVFLAPYVCDWYLSRLDLWTVHSGSVTGKIFAKM